MAGRTWYEALLVVALLAGCGHSSVSVPPGSCPTFPSDPALTAVDVRRSSGRPHVALVVREGDPRSAVAALVVTGGDSNASTALAALIEARVTKAGFAFVDSRADRNSLRIRTLVETPDQAGAFVAAVRQALVSSVAPGSPELALVAQRLASLKRHPVDAAIALSVARCTGELGILGGERSLDPLTAEGAAELDAIRARAYAGSRVAFGGAGGTTVMNGLASAVQDGEGWPGGSYPAEAGALEDQAAAFTVAGRLPGTARVTVALSTERAETAVAAARQMGGTEEALTTRLRMLAVPYRVVDVGATVRPQGGCLAVTLETIRPTMSGSSVEEHAALAAAVARQEIDRARIAAEAEVSGAAAGEATPLGFEGGRAVRAAADPREAAELAALWSFTTPAPLGQSVTVALALPPPNLDPREPSADLNAALQLTSARFAAALERTRKAWGTALLERRERVERGQGELWILLASPCGLQPEGESDSGFTALALMTALTERAAKSAGVSLEPWISPDGVGIVAHAARLPGESATGIAARVAEEAARTLAAPAFSPAAFAAARAALLQRVGDGISAEGRAFGVLAGALAPGHPSWIAPLGSWDNLAKAGVEMASLRWAALAQGPLRLAVLDNEDAQQTETAALTIDRWLSRASDQPRACSPVDPPGPAKSGFLLAALASPAPLAQALLGLPMAPPGTAETMFAELTLAALNGADGWLAKALGSGSLGASAQARLVGGSATSALVVDIRAPESTLELAVAQVRGLLQRLRQGAVVASDFERSLALRERWELETSLDPRRRLVDLWRAAGRSAPPSLDGWRAWAALVMKDEKLVVVLARPKH